MASINSGYEKIISAMPSLKKLPKEFSETSLEKMITAFEKAETNIRDLNTQRTHLVNEKDALRESINDFVMRVRAATKAIYGSDSSEYELVGGTRKSDRKHPVRKPRAPKPPVAA